ncbi:unnamed protein product [Rotaria magnacalcarata]
MSLSDSNYSEATSTMTDTEGHRVASTVSAKRLKLTDIDQPDDREKFNETASAHNAVAVTPTYIETVKSIPCSAVSVVRVSKFNQATLRNSIISQLEQPINVSSAQLSRSDQVNVIKIPRDKSTSNRRARTMSVDNISTIDLNKNIITVKPMRNESRNVSLGSSKKASKWITVAKIPRKCMTSQSRPS